MQKQADKAKSIGGHKLNKISMGSNKVDPYQCNPDVLHLPVYFFNSRLKPFSFHYVRRGELGKEKEKKKKKEKWR
jgi:hypothetical protein